MAPAASSGPPPVYVLLFTHHYLGLGGYYPNADQVRAVVDACVDADMAAHCTLFFDGILVARLAQEDASLAETVRQHGFPIGYHGEEAHGPFPVVISVNQLNVARGPSPDRGLYKPGMDFAQTTEAIYQRYTHDYSAPRFDQQGYLLRGIGGTSAAGVGGIEAVRRWSGSDPQVMPGHCLFQPAATAAFDRETDLALLQAAGPFAPHFLGATHNVELQAQVKAFLGQDDLLFWYMGHLAEKGSRATMFPMWNTASLVPKASRAGGGRGRGGAGRAGGGRPDGGRPGGGPKPPKNADGSWPSPGQSRASSPGTEVRAAVMDLDRSRPHLVSMKIDGAKDDVAATLSFMDQWTQRDPSVHLVSPLELRSHVASSRVTLDAVPVAQAVLSSWAGRPADSLNVDGTPLSQADAFEVLARHLAGAGDRITTSDVLGPIAQQSALVQGTGTVTADEVRAAAAVVVAAIDQDPNHAIPVTVDVGEKTVGFHQFHWLMATLVAQGEDTLAVPATGYAPPFAHWLADALGRSNPDLSFWMECQYWTIKPAVWL